MATADSSNWVPAAYVGNQGCVPGSLLGPEPGSLGNQPFRCKSENGPFSFSTS